MTVRVPAGLVACAIAASLAGCEAHVVAVPAPRFDALPRAFRDSLPVVLTVEVQDPPVVGAYIDRASLTWEYDYTVPDLRAAVEAHVAAAATAFGFGPQGSARLRLAAQAEPYVRAEAQGGIAKSTGASTVGSATLSDERGPIFTAPLLGRARLEGKVDPTAAFTALDVALERWFGALDAKIRSQPETARRIRGP